MNAPAAKVLFVIFRRTDLSHEQCLAEWKGDQHTSIVKRVPGLRRWVQDHAHEGENGAKADGVGELWFESVEAMAKAMTSPEMAAAVEDAKRFLDMTRTYALTVDETTIVA
jgi:uncharacterized protein (TIGR02118 family)